MDLSINVSQLEFDEFLYSRFDQSGLKVIHVYLHQHIDFMAFFNMLILKFYPRRTFVNIRVLLVNLIRVEVGKQSKLPISWRHLRPEAELSGS